MSSQHQRADFFSCQKVKGDKVCMFRFSAFHMVLQIFYWTHATMCGFDIFQMSSRMCITHRPCYNYTVLARLTPPDLWAIQFRSAVQYDHKAYWPFFFTCLRWRWQWATSNIRLYIIKIIGLIGCRSAQLRKEAFWSMSTDPAITFPDWD